MGKSSQDTLYISFRLNIFFIRPIILTVKLLVKYFIFIHNTSNKYLKKYSVLDSTINHIDFCLKIKSLK
jgi:hypothetical protein